MSRTQGADIDGAKLTARAKRRARPRSSVPVVRSVGKGNPQANGNGNVNGNGNGHVNGNDHVAPPFRMPKLRPPTFSQRVIDVRDHGAVTDGETDTRMAFLKAIDACARAGGGRVLVPAGRWFVAGPIHLKSNVNLHLAEGAVVRFSADPKHYLPPVFVRWGGQECYNYSPLIYARDCSNVAITGPGTLIGQGQSWSDLERQQQAACDRLYKLVLGGVPTEQRRFGDNGEPALRPQFVLLINCNNVLLEDFAIADGGPLWNVHAAYCQNVTVRRLRIDAPDGPNNDGIVIDSSRNVLIEHCELSCSDDCIALKSGMNEDGWRVGKPTENVIVRHIRATHGRGGMTIGSDMSGGVRNVFVHDCHYDGPSTGIRLKAARGRGGTVENVFIQNITMGRIPGDAIQFTTDVDSFAKPDGRAPIFRNIRISDVTCESAKVAVRMVGLPDAPFQDIRLQNVTIAADEGLSCTACNRIDLVDVRITPRRGPVMSLRDGSEVLIEGLNIVESASVFLDLRGRLTRNIRLRSTNANGGRPTVVLGIDVPTDVLVHE